MAIFWYYSRDMMYIILLSFRYQVRWWASIYIQKLILFILQKGNKVFCLNIGILFIASLQYFFVVKKVLMHYLPHTFIIVIIYWPLQFKRSYVIYNLNQIINFFIITYKYIDFLLYYDDVLYTIIQKNIIWSIMIIIYYNT